MNDGSVIIHSEIWTEDYILSDIWFEGDSTPYPEAQFESVANYYLYQMNFVGVPRAPLGTL